jgi:cation-transporting ATPase I
MSASGQTAPTSQASAGLLGGLLAFLRTPHRPIWHGPERLHVQVRAPEAGSKEEELFAEAVRSLFEPQQDGHWARYNAQIRRVVIDSPAAVGKPQAFVRRLEELEERLGLLELSLASPAGTSSTQPGDLEPILREALELAMELAGGGMGMVLQGSGMGTRLGVDLAMLLRSVESVPGLREAIEGTVGAGTAELVLSMANGVDHALLRGVAGPLVALLEHALRLRSRIDHHRLWTDVEADLSGAPNYHPERCPVIGKRPTPLREGAIERYAEKAGMLALGAFGFGVAASRDMEGAAGAVLAALPRPAVLGRSAFALDLSRRLAEIGALVLNPEALERLDRIDCLVIDHNLLDAVWGQALLTAARQAGLRRVVVADPQQPFPGDADQRCPPGKASIAAVRALQSQGLGVMVFAGADLPALAAADVAVGFRTDPGKPPWGAHVMAEPDLSAAWLLLPACEVARRCSSQSVQASQIEVVVGLALCLDGVNPQTTIRVNQATHLLAAITMANGIRLARGIEASPPEPAADTIPWHAMDVEDVLERLGVDRNGRDPDSGVDEASREAASVSAWRDFSRLVKEELDNPLVPVLATGAALSALVSSPLDAALILGVVGVNALIGASQRRRVEMAVAALQERSAAPAWVKHDGEVKQIDANRLRVGDILVLEAGEVVPADARILESEGLQVDESILTGESFPVDKACEPSDAPALAERSSMLFSGTTVVSGMGLAVVIAVGDATEARRGLAAVRGIAGPGGVEARLDSLTQLTAPIASMSGLAVVLSALARGQDPRAALSEGVALAVAAVPEGLPILASLAQLAAAGRLSTENVLVRNPRAIESLGRVNVICLDKTGTLTSGRIELVHVSDGQGRMELAPLDRSAFRVLRVGLWATPSPEAGKELAHPTDRALVDAARKAKVSGEGWDRLSMLPFEPARGYHASLGRRKGRCLLCVKGSPEIVLGASRLERTPLGPVPMDEDCRKRLEGLAQSLASQGLRVLAVGRRVVEDETTLSDAQVSDLEFVGFLGLADPIRPTAKEAMADLRRAGIAVKIITGDHPATARAIAAELDVGTDGSVLTGPMLEAMDDTALAQAVLSAAVFARVSSMQKLRLVKALRQAGKLVAMTGDGANDAPAIRLADVGIALGSRATEAARSAADIVVTDGQLETIVRAVLEGRALWRSVRDAVGMLVGGNLGEIGYTLLNGVVQGRSPLNTRQLLLMNLLTDVAPALAIAVRPPGQLNAQELLLEGPEASLGQALNDDILRTAAITALTSGVARAIAGVTATPQAADTVGLLTLVGTQLSQGMATRRVDGLTLLASLGSMGGLLATVQTPILSQAFGCRPLGPLGLLQAGAATAVGTGISVVAPLLRQWLAQPSAGGSPSEAQARGSRHDSEARVAPKATRTEDGGGVDLSGSCQAQSKA